MNQYFIDGLILFDPLFNSLFRKLTRDSPVKIHYGLQIFINIFSGVNHRSDACMFLFIVKITEYYRHLGTFGQVIKARLPPGIARPGLVARRPLYGAH